MRHDRGEVKPHNHPKHTKKPSGYAKRVVAKAGKQKSGSHRPQLKQKGDKRSLQRKIAALKNA